MTKKGREGLSLPPYKGKPTAGINAGENVSFKMPGVVEAYVVKGVDDGKGDKSAKVAMHQVRSFFVPACRGGANLKV